MNLLFLLFIFKTQCGLALPLEVTAQNTPYPYIKADEKIIFNIKGTQKTSTPPRSQKTQNIEINSFIPLAEKLTAKLSFKPNSNLNFGFSVTLLEEYEFSIYTPYVFFYTNQSLPISGTQTITDEERFFSRLQEIRPQTSMGFYTIKELNITDIFSNLELKYHHPKNYYSFEQNNLQKTSDQFSIHADLGFNFYIPDTKIALSSSAGGEFRGQSDLNPYWNFTSQLSYLFSKKMQLKTNYKNETLLTNNKNKDEENLLSLNLQYSLF